MLTIIMPVYNKETYVTGILEDLLSQTFRDFELIVVNDGSTDHSGEICDRYARMDARIRVLHLQNGGVSHARNTALDLAKGDYITFVDGDDRIPPDYLAHLYQSMEKYRPDLVIGGYCKIWPGSSKREQVALPYNGYYKLSDLLPEFAAVQGNTGIYGYCWAKLFAKKLLDGQRFNETLRLAEDLDFYLSLYPKVKTVYFDNQCSYEYLQAAENSSMLMADDKIDYFSQLLIQKKIILFLEERGAFTGENKARLSRRISDYIFFTLYHAPADCILSLCGQIRRAGIGAYISLNGAGWMEKWMVHLFRLGWDQMIKGTVTGYQFIKKILHR